MVATLGGSVGHDCPVGRTCGSRASRTVPSREDRSTLVQPDQNDPDCELRRLRAHPLTTRFTEDAARIAAAADTARTDSARTVYAHVWRQWERWCTARGLNAPPGDPAALCAYLAGRAATGTAVAPLNVAC